MSISKGNWTVGKTGGTVVTDNAEGFPINTGHSGKENTDYYGGNLIAESILKIEDARLITAAPLMLATLQHIVKYWGEPQPSQSMYDHIRHSLKLAEQAINKATNE